jgi:FkbM family methyltransferase
MSGSFQKLIRRLTGTVELAQHVESLEAALTAFRVEQRRLLQVQARAQEEVEARWNQRCEALEAQIAAAQACAQAAADGGARLMQSLDSLGTEVAYLRKSAPGRGNLALPDNRLLTRVSLPHLFPHADPIYFVNADDKLIVPKLAMSGYYEGEATEFVGRTVRPNDHVVDVGANFGYYTVMFAMLAGWKGKVLAFEPEPRMHALLNENLVINWVETWSRVIQAACADAPGQLRFFTSKARAANTGPVALDLGEALGQDFAFTPIDVSAVRIDDSLDYLEGRVDFMKVDVEGGEPLVFRGAQQTIAANPQIRIMMEWSPSQLRAAGHDLEVFARELESLGLDCHAIGAGGQCEPLDFAALPERDYSNLVLARRA